MVFLFSWKLPQGQAASFPHTFRIEYPLFYKGQFVSWFFFDLRYVLLGFLNPLLPLGIKPFSPKNYVFLHLFSTYFFYIGSKKRNRRVHTIKKSYVAFFPIHELVYPLVFVLDCFLNLFVLGVCWVIVHKLLVFPKFYLISISSITLFMVIGAEKFSL